MYFGLTSLAKFTAIYKTETGTFLWWNHWKKIKLHRIRTYSSTYSSWTNCDHLTSNNTSCSMYIVQRAAGSMVPNMLFAVSSNDGTSPSKSEQQQFELPVSSNCCCLTKVKEAGEILEQNMKALGLSRMQWVAWISAISSQSSSSKLLLCYESKTTMISVR